MSVLNPYFRKICVLASLLVCFFCSVSHGQERSIIRLEDANYRNLGREIHLVEESNTSFNVDYVAGLPQSAYWRATHDIINNLHPGRPVWAKLSFESAQDQVGYLIIDFAVIDAIDVYYYNDRKELVHLRSGNSVAHSPQSIVSPSFIFQLQDLPSGVNTVYVRVATAEPFLLPIKVADSQDFIQNVVYNNALNIIYAGIAIMALLFNISLYIQGKQRRKIVYSLYIATTAMFLLFYMKGYSHYFNDAVRHVFMDYGMILFMGSLGLAMLFANDFLQVKKYYPKVILISYALMALSGVGALFAILSFRYIACTMAQVLILCVGAYIGSIGFALLRNKEFRKEFPIAKFYVAGWILTLLGHMYYVLALLNIVPINDLGLQMPIICSGAEFIFITLALYGHRFRLLNVKSVQIEEENTRLIKERNIYLEEKVNERTVEMQVLIDALENSNVVKDKMFSIIAHDLRSPVNNFISLLQVMDSGLGSPEELRVMIGEVNKDAKQIQRILDNLLDWSLLQINEKEAKPERIMLKQFLEEHYQVYHLLVKNKNITATIVCDEDFCVNADRNHLSLILRNLIDNAIKFTPIDGTIEIGVREELMRKCAIYVSNSGKGMSRPMIKAILRSKTMKASYGTANEKGVGLGLQLCKEFIKNMFSELKIESVENELTTFFFELPLIRIPVAELQREEPA